MTEIINVSHLSYQYPKSDHRILQDVSFGLLKGEICCLLGPNGCGKSTLIKILANELIPTAGQIHHEKSLQLGYISQNLDHILFAELTLEENLTLLNIHFSNLLEKKQYFDEYHPKLFSYLHHPLSLLSGGEKQAFALAVTLYHGPQLLLLDEHTSALDPETEQKLMQLTGRKIKENNITLLMCTHKMNLVNQYVSHVIGINKGKVVVDDQRQNLPQALTAQQLEQIYF